MPKYLENNIDLNQFIDVLDELPVWSAPFGLKLLEYVEYRPNISVLDIGFGTGFPLTELALRLGNTATVYGIDPWKETFERVRKKIELYKLKNIRLIEGAAENIPLEDKSIDLITSNNGINNVNDAEAVLSECARVMKQGGQFIQTMNTGKSMFEFYSLLESVFNELELSKNIPSIYQHIDAKRPPVNVMLSKIRKYGFAIKNLEYDQFNYTFADGTAMLNHYFIRLAFMPAWIKLIPPNDVEKVFSLVETKMNEQAKLMGGIKLSIPFVLINAVKQ